MTEITQSPIRELSDNILMDELKHQGAMWFNNLTLLMLDELFRRYNRQKEISNAFTLPSPE